MGEQLPKFFPQSLFAVERFQEEYKDDKFVESLTYKLMNTARRASASDVLSQDFHTLFATALAALGRLRSEVEEETVHLERDRTAAEESYQRSLGDLRKEMEELFSCLGNLDDRMSSIGNTAFQVGKRLEHIDDQKRRAIEARDLLEYIRILNSSKPEWPRLFTDPTQMYDAAVVVQKLGQCLANLSNPQFDQAVKNVEAYMQDLERRLMQRFDEGVDGLKSAGSRDESLDTMRQCASILGELHRGEEVARRYVMMNDLFLKYAREGLTDEAPVEQVTTLSYQNLPTLGKLFQEIEECMEHEHEIIRAVFPDPDRTMQLFVQRIFEETVSEPTKRRHNDCSS